MFANPFWSLLLLAAPIALYWFVIRPRLETRFLDLYSGLDGFWERVWARTYKFRTFWIAVFWAVATALPDILVQIAPLDFSSFLPQPWAAYTGPGCAICITLMNSFTTKRGEAT